MRSRWLLLTAVLGFMAGPVGAQDRVVLTTGASMDGSIIEESESSVVIEFQGGTARLPRHMIKEIVRGVPDPDQDAQRTLKTLSRFTDHESHHFLYRDGRRVGYRTITLSRDVVDGIPGYRREDRLVFLPAPGAPPEVDVKIVEFADAELRPLAFSHHVTSGASIRTVEGRREDGQMRMVERSGGIQNIRSALLRSEAEFPGLMLKRLAAQPVPTGGYIEKVVFDPKQLDIHTERLQRRPDRVAFRGQVKNVVIFSRGRGPDTLATWLDMAGNVVREEIGSPNLISLRVPRKEVEAYARGEEGVLGDDLGLEFHSERCGLRFLRPSLTWEVTPGTPENMTLLSLLRPSMRATVDVLELTELAPGVTVESVALELFERMERGSRNLRIDGPVAAQVGDRPGLRFEARCRKDDEELRTLGTLLVDGERAFVFLCAAPARFYAQALPDFNRLIQSIRIDRAEEEAPPESAVEH